MFITVAVWSRGSTMAPATTASAKTWFQSPKPGAGRLRTGKTDQ
jgi:hypothetical protein